MIQGILVNKIVQILSKQFSLGDIAMLLIKFKKLEKEVNKLKKLAHPKSDFVCTNCGTKAKRVKKTINKLKEKF